MKTTKKVTQEDPSLRALKIIAMLKHQIQPAELQLDVIDKLLPGYERVPQEASRIAFLPRAAGLFGKTDFIARARRPPRFTQLKKLHGYTPVEFYPHQSNFYFLNRTRSTAASSSPVSNGLYNTPLAPRFCASANTLS